MLAACVRTKEREKEDAAVGIVERLNARGFRGWVDYEDPADNVVCVVVNGIEVAQTSATRPIPFEGGEANFGFNRRLDGLWQFLDANDEVTFEHRGRRLPIVGHGYVYRPEMPREKSYDDLVTRVAKGWTLDKRGKLSPPFGRSPRAKAFIREYNALRASVLEHTGSALFPSYGTLLGCIREGGFIAHDNDIDLSYISAHRDPEGVIQEFIRLSDSIIDAGYRVRILPGLLKIQHPIPVDIFPAWVNQRGEFDLAWGYTGEPVKWSREMGEFETRDLDGFEVEVPAGAEQILEQIYGPTWRIPDPGFHHSVPTRRQDLTYHATEQQLRPIFWKNYYKHNDLAEGSTFSQFVEKRISPAAVIVDVGCGSGRDSTYFASQGFFTLGADASAEGVKHGQDRGLPNARFAVIDVSSPEQLDVLFASPEITAAAEEGREIVVYLRFFLHAIPEDVEDTLLEAIVRNLPSVTLAAEFRTEADADLDKFNAAHYRRFVNAEALKDKLHKRFGFMIDYFHEGQGLSVFQGEDPVLCRIMAMRAEAPE
jgi:SAM-dependent methyltransferase